MTERRYHPVGLEIEQRVGTDPPYTLTGYAAVFYDPKDDGSQFELWNYGAGTPNQDRCVERILPEA